MYTILFIAVLAGIYNSYKSSQDVWNTTYCVMIDGFVGLIFGAFAGFILALLLPNETYVSEESQEIVVLNDARQISGYFYVGSGLIENEIPYVVYVKNFAGIQLKRIPAKNTKVMYSDEKPSVVTYTKRSKKTLANHFSISLDNGVKGYAIYVPEGTINSKFQLDAQ